MEDGPVQEVAKNTELMELLSQLLIAFGVPPILVGAGGGSVIVIGIAFIVYKLTASKFVPWESFALLRDRVAYLEGKTEDD